MPDLNFAQLQAELPTGAIEYDGVDDVVISLKALMETPTVVLNDYNVALAISKLLDGCADAQITYNAASPNDVDLRAYNRPTAGAPTRNAATGEYRSTLTYTVALVAPLDRDVVAAFDAA